MNKSLSKPLKFIPSGTFNHGMKFRTDSYIARGTSTCQLHGLMMISLANFILDFFFLTIFKKCLGTASNNEDLNNILIPYL